MQVYTYTDELDWNRLEPLHGLPQSPCFWITIHSQNIKNWILWRNNAQLKRIFKSFDYTDICD